jgi:hypothetical protein
MITYSNSFLTFPALDLKLIRLLSSILTFLRFSYNSLIFSSFSSFFWHNLFILSTVASMNANHSLVVATGFSLTSPVTGTWVTTDRGAPSATVTFLTLSYMIRPIFILYVKIRMSTISVDRKGSHGPRPNTLLVFFCFCTYGGCSRDIQVHWMHVSLFILYFLLLPFFFSSVIFYFFCC